MNGAVVVPETTRGLGRQRLSQEKPALCQKPVITAIIQLQLICIIKVCCCVAVEAAVSRSLYQR